MLRKRIGNLFVERKLLTEAQVEQIVAYGLKSGLRFGDAGIALQMLKPANIFELLGPNSALDFFYLDPRFYPQTTKNLLPIEVMTRLGVLPLGRKRVWKWFKTLDVVNLGLLDPLDKKAVSAIQDILQTKTKSYLVLPDQFADVLKWHYQWTPPTTTVAKTQLHPVLWHAIEGTGADS